MALTRPKYSQIYDTDYKQSVRLATTADVGNLLAGGSNITNSVDGKTVAVNDRILVKDQSDSKQNGIYRVAVAGTGSNGTWIRALDADASDKVTSGMTATVSEGDNNAGKTFKLSTPDPITLGTTALTFINPFIVTATSAGANTQIQFGEYGGILGASANLTFDKGTNVLTVTGNANVSGYYLGDGSLLSGVDTDATRITSGNTNVKAYSSNISMGVNGTANVVNITSSTVTVPNITLANSAGGSGATIFFNSASGSIDFIIG